MSLDHSDPSGHAAPSTQGLWQDENGKRWVKHQAHTDAQLEPLGEVALEALAPAPGERIADIGCGGGQTVLELARRVGSGGRITGVDVSPPLLELCRTHLEASGQQNVDLVLGDAAQVRLAEPQDALFSRFGVMFFDEPAVAFHNLLQNLRVGGRVSFLCWQGLAKNPWAELPLEAVRRLLPGAELPEMLLPERPGPFRFGQADFAVATLAAAGFHRIQLEPHEGSLRLGGAMNLEEAVQFCLEIGPSARMISRADPLLLPAFRDSLARALTPYQSPEGVRLPYATYVMRAERP